jgi:hypothetical protein
MHGLMRAPASFQIIINEVNLEIVSARDSRKLSPWDFRNSGYSPIKREKKMTVRNLEISHSELERKLRQRIFAAVSQNTRQGKKRVRRRQLTFNDGVL